MSPIAVNTVPMSWDPYKVLNLHPDEHGYTCVGKTKKRGNPRCGLAVAVATREKACSILDAMGEIHPSQITQKSLVAVASYTLCKRYHSKDDDQVLDKVDEWQNKIEDYLDQCDKPQAESADLVGEVQQLRKELEEAKQQIQSNSAIKHLQQQFKTTRKNLDDTTQELDRATAHNIKLAQQFLKLQTQIDDANRTAMELREHITARDERIKDVKAESAEVVGDLEGQLAEKNSTIKALEETNLASHKEIEALQQQSAEEIGDLEGQLAEKDSTIRALEETNQESNSEIDILRRYFEERNTESNAKVSDLQQENRRLKAQKHFQLFRKQVQLVFKKRRCEYAETENRTLSEQLERMIKQLGDRDMQVAEHDVSTFCRHRGVLEVIGIFCREHPCKSANDFGCAPVQRQ